jgi:hypothetical protein
VRCNEHEREQEEQEEHCSHHRVRGDDGAGRAIGGPQPRAPQ